MLGLVYAFVPRFVLFILIITLRTEFSLKDILIADCCGYLMARVKSNLVCQLLPFFYRENKDNSYTRYI